MRRDTSSNVFIALAEQIQQLVRTCPANLAEELYNSDLSVEILRVGLDLYIQQEQSSAVSERMQHLFRDTSSQSRIAEASQLRQLVRINPADLVGEMYASELAVEILRVGLDLYIQQEQSSSEIGEIEEKILPTFLEKLDPPLVLDLTEISCNDLPAHLQEQVGSRKVYAWSYRLSREDKHISGHFLSGSAISVKPNVWAVVRDLLSGDMIDDYSDTSEDTQRLYTLFDEEEIESMRSMGWE